MYGRFVHRSWRVSIPCASDAFYIRLCLVLGFQIALDFYTDNIFTATDSISFNSLVILCFILFSFIKCRPCCFYKYFMEFLPLIVALDAIEFS